MLVEKAYGQYTDFRIPGMVATENGSLIRYCECRKSMSDWAYIDIKVSRSTDEGKTWQDVLLIEGGENTLNNPVMFVCEKKLVFLYCKNYREVYKCVSDNDGESFGEITRVNFEGGVNFPYTVVALGPGHGICHGERLTVPAWFAYDPNDLKAHNPSFATTFYSDDRGESWRVGEPIFPDVICNGSEGALAITKDGEYLISLRHTGEEKTRALVKSPDGISGWHSLRFEKNLTDPTCMSGMTHGGGLIYHVNCDTCGTDSFWTARTNLTLKISEDEFRTVRALPISELGGYADVALLNDKICVLYEKTVRPFELFFETFSIS